MKRADEEFRDALLAHSRLDGNVVITDFRELDNPPVGNRFLIYCLFPGANVSVRIHWGPQRKYPVMVLGHNIFDRSCRSDVGEIAARHGGGGHRGAASVPLIEEADFQIRQIVAELKAREHQASLD
jgi:nanoRNase/pAp phosphatase (c-di-AMP/oligoRNAs hydrolase)